MEAATVTVPRILRPRRRDVSDERLAARVRAGDEAAFECLYDRYHAGLLAFCRHMLGSREEAEDALQHVFVAAHRQLSGDAGPVELRPWLYRVARNRCLSMLRSRRQAVALDDVAEPEFGGLALAAEVEQRQDLKDLLVDLGRLPDEQRAALVLAELGDLSHAEIAGALEVRTEKVKALVFQARDTLIGWREARAADCQEVRQQLATLRGGSLRRSSLRRHVEVCPSCHEFREQVRRQRAALAIVLPVVSTGAVRRSVIHAALAAGPGGAGAAVAGGAATIGGAGGAALGSGLVAKGLVVAALAGGLGGGGYVAARDLSRTHQAPPRTPAPAHLAPASAAAAHAPASPTAAPTPAAGTPVRRGRVHHVSGVPVRRGPVAHSRGRGPQPVGTNRGRHLGTSAAPTTHARGGGVSAAGNSAGSAQGGGQAHRQTPVRRRPSRSHLSEGAVPGGTVVHDSGSRGGSADIGAGRGRLRDLTQG